MLVVQSYHAGHAITLRSKLRIVLPMPKSSSMHGKSRRLEFKIPGFKSLLLFCSLLAMCSIYIIYPIQPSQYEAIHCIVHGIQYS